MKVEIVVDRVVCAGPLSPAELRRLTDAVARAVRREHHAAAARLLRARVPATIAAGIATRIADSASAPREAAR